MNNPSSLLQVKTNNHLILLLFSTPPKEPLLTAMEVCTHSCVHHLGSLARSSLSPPILGLRGSPFFGIALSTEVSPDVSLKFLLIELIITAWPTPCTPLRGVLVLVKLYTGFVRKPRSRSILRDKIRPARAFESKKDTQRLSSHLSHPVSTPIPRDRVQYSILTV